MRPLKEIKRINFLHNINMDIRDSRYDPDEETDEFKTIKALIPESIDKDYADLITELVNDMKEMTKEEREKFFREIPPGYLRFRLVDVIINDEPTKQLEEK